MAGDRDGGGDGDNQKELHQLLPGGEEARRGFTEDPTHQRTIPSPGFRALLGGGGGHHRR